MIIYLLFAIEPVGENDIPAKEGDFYFNAVCGGITGLIYRYCAGIY